MLRLLVGGIKGAVLGAGLGYGAYRLGLAGGWGYVLYGAVGFTVGLLVGRPIWSHLWDKESTAMTSLLKGIFGFGVGAGLFALFRNLVTLPTLSLLGETRAIVDWPFVFGGSVGFVFGALLELDDPPRKKLPAPPARAALNSGGDKNADP